MIRAFLPVVLIGLAMSAIFMLPPFEQTDSAIDLEFESFVGDWKANPYPPSQKEIDILDKETEFSKARCSRLRFEEVSLLGPVPTDVVDLSIVLSGNDLANSIHRPERCMPAQGHRALQTSSASIALPSGITVPVTRIVSKKDVEIGQTEEERRVITLNYLTYYFFVGQKKLTASHTERTLIDIKDRVLHGKAQRWAYVTGGMAYRAEGEENPWNHPSLELADKKIREVLTALAEENIDWSQVTP